MNRGAKVLYCVYLALLMGFTKILDAVADSFVTSLSTNQISALVRMQLSDFAEWNIERYTVTGTSGSSTKCYSAKGQKLYVMKPDEASVAKAKEMNVKVYLAEDAVCGKEFKNDTETQVAPSNDIPDGWEGLDIGPKTEAIYADVIKNSKTILWNGPTGVFEFENFTHGSRTVGEAIVEATKNGAFSLVGGGDSVACVNKFGLANGVSYVSTGGGALFAGI